MCDVKVLDIHATLAARVEAERQRRIEALRRETLINAIATVKARLEAEAAARQQIDVPSTYDHLCECSDELITG